LDALFFGTGPCYRAVAFCHHKVLNPGVTQNARSVPSDTGAAVHKGCDGQTVSDFQRNEYEQAYRSFRWWSIMFGRDDPG